MVDQPEYGTNTPYLIDFIKICLAPKLASTEEIRHLYTVKGQSTAQIAKQLRVSKSFVLARLQSVDIRSEEKGKRYTSPDNFRCPVAPFGYSAENAKLIPNKAELRVCHVIVDLMKRKDLSAREVAKELGRRGLKNRAKQTVWSHGSVLSIYRRWKDKL